jgi:hypothetical protein
MVFRLLAITVMVAKRDNLDDIEEMLDAKEPIDRR